MELVQIQQRRHLRERETALGQASLVSGPIHHISKAWTDQTEPGVDLSGQHLGWGKKIRFAES